MYFVSAYTLPADKRNVAQERFTQGGGLAPKWVRMIGRWHSAVGGRGVTFFESDNSQAIAEWAQQ
ncbi:MAG: DUF3303 domain-containing protein [Acidobacteriia bacterium]|nr:DUF3303 domain-containing protein [Terriglobia bacterium]